MPDEVPNRPTTDYPFDAVILDTLLTEFSSKYPGNWTPIEPGTPFSASPTHSVAQVQQFANTISLGQRAGKENEFQQRFWGTVPHTQDIYNYTLTYDQSNPAYPAFKRRYLELRDTYAARAINTAFTGLYAVQIQNPGLGYKPAPEPPPNVTLNNGATAIAVVNPADGSIAKITLKSEGVNCTTSATIDAPPVGGTQATALGILQSPGCVLISEKTGDATAPWDALYLLVERDYETVPGPTINNTRIDFDGLPVNIATSKQPLGSFTSGELMISGDTVWQQTTLKDAGNSVYAVQVVETRAVPGNAIPLPNEIREGGDVVTITSQLVLIGSIIKNESISGSNWIKQYGRPFNGSALVALQITESRPHTGNSQPFDKLDPLDQVPVYGTRQLDLISNIVTNVKEDTSGSDWTRTYMEPMGDSHLVAFQVTETRLIVGPVVEEEGRSDFDKLTVDVTRQLVAVGSIVKGESTSGSNWLVKYPKEHMGSSKVALQYIESRPIVGPVVAEEGRSDFDKLTIDVTRQLVAIGSIVEGESPSGLNWLVQYGRNHQGSGEVALQYTETRPIIGPVVAAEGRIDTDGLPVDITQQLVAIGSIVENEDIAGPNWIRKYGRQHEGSGIVALQFVETRLATGQVQTDYDTREAGDSVTITSQLLPVGSLTTAESISGSTWLWPTAKAHPQGVLVAIQQFEARQTPGNATTETAFREAGDILTTQVLLNPVSSSGPAESVTGASWVRFFAKPHNKSRLVCWLIEESRPCPGNVSAPVNDWDSDNALVAVTEQLVATPVSVTNAISGTTWSKITSRPHPESGVVAWKQVRTRVVPGQALTEVVEHESGIPILETQQRVNASALFICGEFQPPAINVSSVGLGATTTVTLASDPGLPIGAWVRFVGTNSTPVLGSQTSGTLTVGAAYIITTFVSGDDFSNVGAANASGSIFTATSTTPNTWSNGSTVSRAYQIVGLPGTNQVQITPAAAITNAGTAAGTMQALSRITRELRLTNDANVKLKVDRMIFIPDIAAFNYNVECWIAHAFPDFNLGIKSYSDFSSESTTGSGFSFSRSWSGALGFPQQVGFRGEVLGRRMKFYFMGPPPDGFASSYTPTIILPSRGTFDIKGGSHAKSVSSGGVATSNSVHHRTGTTPEMLSGVKRIITAGDTANPGPFTISTIGTGASPLFTTSTAHGMALEGGTVYIEGTNCTPVIPDGYYEVTDVGSPTTFEITAPSTITGAGSAGDVTIAMNGEATPYLDFPQSYPPLLIGQLSIASSSTGSNTPTLTLSGIHYMKPKMFVQISLTNTTPKIDGLYQILSVPGANQIQITTAANVTVTGTGSAQFFITVLNPPRKLGFAGAWDCDLDLMQIPYNSGSNPP